MKNKLVGLLVLTIEVNEYILSPLIVTKSLKYIPPFNVYLLFFKGNRKSWSKSVTVPEIMSFLTNIFDPY
jgi:hypothetical protein